MKKLLCLSMLACVFYAGCRNPAPTATGADSTAKVATSQSMPVDSTDKILGADISPEELKMLVDNFKVNAKPNGDAPLTTSVWFKITELENMVAKLRKDSLTATKPDGVRIYFGTYPKKGESGMQYQHPGQNTIIFVSTTASVSTRDNKSNHVNYYNDGSKNMIAPFNRGQLCEPSCDDDEIVIPDKAVATAKK